MSSVFPITTGCLYLTSSQGYKLSNHAFAYHRDSNVLACFHRCLPNPVCQSINYWLANSICELNNRTREARAPMFGPAEGWVYFENPKRALIGTQSNVPAISCKEIRDTAGNNVTLKDGEYWIDPETTGNPFTVYCDMKTDGGGWTLIAQTIIKHPSEASNGLHKIHDFRGITNYTNNQDRVDIPSLFLLRNLIGFCQLRYYCTKKTTGRTVHIMTNKSTNGLEVVNYFTIGNRKQPLACGSYEPLSDDNSIVSSDCKRWGEYGVPNWPGRWGYYVHSGDFRVYNDPIYWNGTAGTHYVNMIPGSLYCDEGKNGTNFSVGDAWKLFVR